jgi:hypothetical protein
MVTLVWQSGYDGYFAWTEQYEYSFGGDGIGGLGPPWLDIAIKRKSDGKVFDKKWFRDGQPDLSPESVCYEKARCFCQGFEDGHVIVFPWEWK